MTISVIFRDLRCPKLNKVVQRPGRARPSMSSGRGRIGLTSTSKCIRDTLHPQKLVFNPHPPSFHSFHSLNHHPRCFQPLQRKRRRIDNRPFTTSSPLLRSHPPSSRPLANPLFQPLPLRNLCPPPPRNRKRNQIPLLPTRKTIPPRPFPSPTPHSNLHRPFPQSRRSLQNPLPSQQTSRLRRSTSPPPPTTTTQRISPAMVGVTTFTTQD